ncbi:hypothetical protein SO802_019351 [Lithocarpus litseifolius]|uniref:Uncharacterized protein n=1 Tax=Lithocarpus litseifolius TaxID=425828 RepID=A0AAW2CPN9_9ROSI
MRGIVWLDQTISRIVSETLRLGLEDVHWFVMGDDDTVFVTVHLQNIYFSYGMAYGGGGFAISYPLAKAKYLLPSLSPSDHHQQQMLTSIASTIATAPQLAPVRTYGLRVEGIKQSGSDLGRVCMQFRPFDYRRGRFQIANSGASLSHFDRRTPIMRSIGMSVICAAASCGFSSAVWAHL